MTTRTLPLSPFSFSLVVWGWCRRQWLVSLVVVSSAKFIFCSLIVILFFQGRKVVSMYDQRKNSGQDKEIIPD